MAGQTILPKNKRQATMADVAREAGVSAQTVSRVINNKDYVSEKTRKRVQDAIKALAYTPHAPAQQLRAGNVRTIAVLYPLKHPDKEPINQLQLDFAVGAAAGAGNANYFCNLMTASLSEEELLGLYRSMQVNGTVLMEVHLRDWRADILREHDYPFVMIGQCEDNEGLSYIELDMHKGIIKAFNHLVELGHRKIGFLTFSNAWYEAGFGLARRLWTGYREAIDKFGLECIYRQLEFTTEDMYSATNQLLETHPDLTAIVSATDASTSGVIHALHQRNIRVPDRFSVVSFSTDRMAETITPPLTSIRFPAYEMGFQAASILIKKLDGEFVDQDQILLNPELVVRRTTGPVLE